MSCNIAKTLIIVTDIFGRTASIDQLIQQLSSAYSNVSIIDPYLGEKKSFKDEAAAYREFQQQCGLEKLTETLRNRVSASQLNVDLIGFSVGASAVWQLSSETEVLPIGKAAAFYGSRIREKTKITPRIPITLIFPQKEDHFDLKPVIQAITDKPGVEIIKTSFLHGFMNNASKNFNNEGYDMFCEWLMSWVATDMTELI